MKNNINITFETGEVSSFGKGITVRELLNIINNNNVVALRINGNITDADEEILENSKVEYIYISDRIGKKIYIKGLEYVYICAVKELYGDDSNVEVKHSIDKGIYTELNINRTVNETVLKNIKKKMRDIINMDLPFKKVSVNRMEAIEYVNNNNEKEKALNYTYTTNDSVTMYELYDIYNYFYYVMPSSTKILDRFDLTLTNKNGIVISFPVNNVIPKYNHIPKVLDAFKSYEKNICNMGVRYVGDLNKLICQNKISDYIQANEILYDLNIENIVKKIKTNKNIKAVYISGPSSSGKTTTSKKLALNLKAKGIDTMVLSTDDYFLERNQSPRKPDGSYEFEILEAIDVKLFNDQIKNLLASKEVVIPKYNFITGEKEYKNKPVKLNENQILIIEGLHAVNDKLSSAIDDKNKLKIYISPFTPLGIDRHNHISTTDLRFLRRLVRDFMTRGYSASKTIENWIGMRQSEEKYIYPYQMKSDIVINTSLSYEIGVLRTYAEPLLYSIDKDSIYYEEAVRIINFLKTFINIPSEYVPQTSVLREFIGNSYFR